MKHQNAHPACRQLAYATIPNGSTTASIGVERVSVTRGRTRCHPGLVDVAPDTSPFYGFAARALAETARGIDFGCGAGAGTAILLAHWEHVTGWDPDPVAISFARALCSGGAFETGEAPGQSDFDAGVLIDVLGHVRRPFSVLRTFWRSVAPCAPVIVAEPRAHCSQLLMSPARQAFSRRALGGLLGAAGFDVERWASSAAGFNTCLAFKRATSHEQDLEDAIRAMESGALTRATQLLRSASQSESADVRVEVALAEASLAIAASDGDAAVGCFLRASQDGPEDPRPLSGMARLLAMAGDATEARRLADGAVELDPTDASAHAILALLVETQAPVYARTCWHAATHLAPSDPWIVAEFAQRFAQAGSCDAAIAAVERLLDYPDEIDAEFHLAFANVFERAGRTDDARIQARMALARQPDGEEGQAKLSRLGECSAAPAVSA
jgi:Flp pilus assembly protein TadD